MQQERIESQGLVLSENIPDRGPIRNNNVH